MVRAWSEGGPRVVQGRPAGIHLYLCGKLGGGWYEGGTRVVRGWFEIMLLTWLFSSDSLWPTHPQARSVHGQFRSTTGFQTRSGLCCRRAASRTRRWSTSLRSLAPMSRRTSTVFGATILPSTSRSVAERRSPPQKSTQTSFPSATSWSSRSAYGNFGIVFDQFFANFSALCAPHSQWAMLYLSFLLFGCRLVLEIRHCARFT